MNKIVPIASAAALTLGGALVGIGLASPYDMPLDWWLLGLVFICIGLYGLFISKGRVQ